MTRSYWFLISLLAAIWGASYLFIKVAVRDFSPPAMMEIRLAFAALLLGGFLVATRGFRAGARATCAPPAGTASRSASSTARSRSR